MPRFVEEDLPLYRAASGAAPALRPVNVRPPLGQYLSQLWRRRHFLKKQAWAEATSQHQDTLLGNLWLVLSPLLDGMVYFLIFGVMFPQARGGVDFFFGYIVIGVFLFTFTARTLTSCTKVIESNRGLIRAFVFPRASLPVAVVMRELVALLPAVATLIFLLLVIPPGAPLGWHWLLVPAVIALQCLINLGFGFIMARLGSVIPDLKHVMAYLMRFLMYFSCVIWTVDRFEVFPEPVPTIAEHSPFFLLLDAYRELLLNAALPAAGHWLELSAWAVGALVVGFLFFWQGEVQYGRRANA